MDGTEALYLHSTIVPGTPGNRGNNKGKRVDGGGNRKFASIAIGNERIVRNFSVSLFRGNLFP